MLSDNNRSLSCTVCQRIYAADVYDVHDADDDADDEHDDDPLILILLGSAVHSSVIRQQP